QSVKLTTDGSRKNILAAISLDKNRFGEKEDSRRVIIYSDMDIKDNSVNFADPSQAASSLARNYPISFRYSQIAIYGVNDASKSKIVQDYFLSGAGYLNSYGFALPEQSNSPVSSVSYYEGDYEGGGAQGAAELVLAVSNNKDLDNTWIRFTVPQ